MTTAHQWVYFIVFLLLGVAIGASASSPGHDTPVAVIVIAAMLLLVIHWPDEWRKPIESTDLKDQLGED